LFYDCRRNTSVKKAPITIDLLADHPEKYNEECNEEYNEEYKESPLVSNEKETVKNATPYLEIETTCIESDAKMKIGHESKSSNMVIDVDVNSFSIEATSLKIEGIQKSLDEISEGKLKTH
jgi:hypothetical protein